MTPPKPFGTLAPTISSPILPRLEGVLCGNHISVRARLRTEPYGCCDRTRCAPLGPTIEPNEAEDMKIKTAVLMLAIASMICGCGTVGARHTPQTGAASGAKISSYRILEVRPFTTAEELADFGEHVAKIREVLLQYLPAENLFQEVSPEDKTVESNGVLVLDAKLTRAKSVTRTARVMLGIMAGRSGVETEVTLTDKSSGTQVAKEMILVQSALSAGVFSGTDRETINHMAREIINFLKGLR